MSLMTPSGIAVPWLARLMTTPMGFKSPRCSDLQTDVSMTLIEAPRSSMTSVKVQSQMVQGTIKVSGSLYFSGKVEWQKHFHTASLAHFLSASSYRWTNPSRTLHISESV